MGNDATVETSIGQIRVAGNVEKEKIIYDLLHGYHEGGEFRCACAAYIHTYTEVYHTLDKLTALENFADRN